MYISIKIQHQISNNIQSSFFTSFQNQNIQTTPLQNMDWILRTDEELKFSFLQTSSGAIFLTSWGPIEYTMVSWNNTQKGYIFDTSYFIFHWDLYIKNLWWLSKIKLSTQSFSGVIFPYSYEKSTIHIWWQEFMYEFIKKDSL